MPMARTFAAARGVLAAILAAATAGCAPQVNSDLACPRGNLTLTATKDAGLVDRFTAGIDEAMQPVMAGSSPPSCALVVVGDNRIATINAYGADFDTTGDPAVPGNPPLLANVPVVAQTRLYLGSISKTITALGMIRLAEEAAAENAGGIGTGPPVSLLDRPLVDLYPPVADVPEWAAFTPRQYLAHATGVPKDPMPLDLAALDLLPPAAGDHPGIHPRHAFVVYRDTMPRVQGFTGQFDALYSNIGYSLVGAAIDWQTVEQPASDNSGYERYIFQQIGLNHNTTAHPLMLSMCLGASWRAPRTVNLARGYAPGGSSPLDPPDFAGWEGPSGGWTMTIGDLGRMIVAINTNARIAQASRDQMLADVATGPLLGTTNWGLGVYRIPVAGDLIYGKGGDITGFTSDFIAYRDTGAGAGIICNQDSMNHTVMRAAIRDIIDPCYQQAEADRPAYCSP